MSSVIDVSTLDPEQFDISLAPHVMTDRAATKVLPCRVCRRPCVVTTFKAAARTECHECKGDNNSGPGQQVSVIPGRTAPENAVNLADVLINKQFAHAICPFDPDHDVELKSVNHNDHRGPSHFMGIKNGVPTYEQYEPGETVMLQCNDCKTVISLSTAHTQVYQRQNEVKNSASESSPWAWMNGVRVDRRVERRVA